MDFKLTDEIKDKLKKCKSPEEIYALAQENKLDASMEEIKQSLSDSDSEIDLDELEKIAGGCCNKDCDPYSDVQNCIGIL